LHRDTDVTAVLTKAAEPDTVWIPAGKDRTACEVVLDGRRHVVIDSPARRRRDDHRREEFLTRTENELVALTDRVENTKKFGDPAKIGAAAERILARSPVRNCFVTTIGPGTFTWRHDKTALDYEQRLLAGRYVLTTSLTVTQASTGEIVAHYQSLANVEHRFRVMKDFLGLRPVYHWTEDRVRGHIAIFVLAAVIEAVITNELTRAGIRDPDLPEQPITARRALAELNRIRIHHLHTGDHDIRVVTRRNTLQAAICTALKIDTSSWDTATIT
jgi:hypothetical protein